MNVIDPPVIERTEPVSIPDFPSPPDSPSAIHPADRPTDRTGWFPVARIGLLAATAVGYLWGLSASGWANSYYSAATQAGASSWKAWFFGSFDAANSITVDKPPAALWITGLSARLFGVTSWSILVPEALMGVATVALVIAIVRRWFSPGAALLAGAVVATTPVAVLMFRFNNPDALLVLLMTAAAYAITRALEHARTGWLVMAGGLIGLGFLTKMLQAFVVLPAFALVYLICAPTGLRRRIGQLFALGLATITAAGWWVAIVELWPASSRPYIGGSQDNSVLELIFGYNGLGRLTGEQTGAVVGGGGGTSQWGPTGWLRMFNSQFGGQISWLLPAALIALVAGLAATWRRPRTDRTRAALILWGATLLITGITFSLSQGIIHEYYSVALAPAVGVVIGIGAHLAWQHHSSLAGRSIAAGAVAVSGWWAWVLLDRSASWNAWLRPTIAVLAMAASATILAGTHRPRIAALGGALTVAALLAGPTAYAVETISTPHTGSLPTAGPTVAGTRGAGFGGPGGGPLAGGPLAGGPTGGGQLPRGGTRPAGQIPAAGGAPGGQLPPTGTATGGAAGPGTPGGGGPGGLLDASVPDAAVTEALTTDAGDYTWVAAAVGANQAAGYQLAADEPVMAIGGFNGSDPSPTLAEFQQFVAQGDIHWFIAGGTTGRQLGGSTDSADIGSWVAANYTATTIGGVTMYDLST